MKRIVFLVVLYILFSPMSVFAQQAGDFGARLRSKDGKWLLPVATRLNGSDEEKHTGRGSVLAWDLVAPFNTPVYAMGPGKVEYAGCNNAGGYGCWLFINHGAFKAVYGHMVSGSIKVRSGQAVDANTVIGNVGRTGMTSFGPHTHLEMQKPGGGRFRIDQWFDRSQMRFCNLCSVSGQPAVWGGAVAQGLQAQTQVQTQPAPQPVANLDGFTVIGVAFLGLLVLLFLYLTGKSNLVRDAAVLAVVILVPIWVPLWFMSAGVSGVSASQPVTSAAASTSSAMVAGGAWEHAYKFVTRWEGKKCTEDGAHTYAGVTQGAFDRYNARHGLPKTDVCGGLTEEVKRGIFYEDYWLKSGADKLPALLGIAHADFAYNVGTGAKGAAMQVLSSCGTDINCYMKQRMNWYKSQCRNCSAGHVNRTNDMVKFLNDLAK